MAAGEFSGWREKLSTSLLAEQWPDELQSIVTKLANGVSLNREDGHILFNSKNLDSIGSIANIIKYSRFEDRAFFNVNVHINQTNICTLACKFCAFRRGRRAPDAYQLDVDEYIEDLRQYSDHVD